MIRYAFIFLVLGAQLCAAQEVRIIKFEALEKIIRTESSQVQVINFWATWCGPCVKELPVFEKLNAQGRSDIKVTLINLDFAEHLKKVSTFLERRKMKSETLLLDEIDYNSWIDRVDESWGGAIPATLIINSKTGQRKFVEKELTEAELENLITEIL